MSPVTALMGLEAKLRLARTLVVVDTHHDDIPTFVSRLFDAGADLVQFRDVSASLAEVGAAVVAAQQVAMPRNKLVAVTGDLVLAKAVMADVLIGGRDLDPGLAHARLHEYALVGLPVFTAADCHRVAASDVVEFALVGPVHLPSGTTAVAPGLDLVRVAVETMPVADVHGTPWFAVGGITPDRLTDVIAAGARRAGIVVAGESDLADLERVSSALHQAWADDASLQDYAFRALSGPSKAAGLRNMSEPTTW